MPDLIEKGCYNCKLGDIPLKESRVCWNCIMSGGFSKWRKKPRKYTKRS